MAISFGFNRKKPDLTVTKSLSMSAAVAEVGTDFVVDIHGTVIKDDTTTADKTVARVVISRTYVGEELILTPTLYVFPGTAANYTSGGTTPPLSAATANNTLNMSAFLEQAGDTPENS